MTLFGWMGNEEQEEEEETGRRDSKAEGDGDPSFVIGRPPTFAQFVRIKQNDAPRGTVTLVDMNDDFGENLRLSTTQTHV